MKTIEPSFDLNLLRVLVALEQTRNVTRAAQQLDMSQSGFSSALSRLRQHVGDELFVRTAGGMEPTSRCLQMVETAKNVLAQVQDGVLELPTFEPASAQAEFHLAMADVAEIVFLPSLLRALQERAPHARITCQSLPRDELKSALERGGIDLALGYFPDLQANPFFQQRLYTHTYACMLRPGHRALRQRLTEKSFAELGHAVVSSPSRSTDLMEAFLERRGIARRVVLRTPHHMSLPAIIENTDLIATVPLATAARFERLGAIKIVPLPFEPPMFPVQQHWHRRTHHDPRLRWLRSVVAELFNDASDEWRTLETALYGAIRGRRGRTR